MHFIREWYFLSRQLNAQLSCNYGKMLLLSGEEIIGFFFPENLLEAPNLFTVRVQLNSFIRDV